MALLWVLNLSVGTNSVLDIAERSGLSFEELRGGATETLVGCRLLQECDEVG
jgi:aminopeptidase-like protein